MVERPIPLLMLKCMKHCVAWCVAALVALSLAACDTTRSPVPLNVSGTWEGMACNDADSRCVPMTLMLHDVDGQLSGNVIVLFVTADVSGVRSGTTASMNITGEWVEPGVTLTGTFTPTRFNGSWRTSTDTSTVTLEKR